MTLKRKLTDLLSKGANVRQLSSERGKKKRRTGSGLERKKKRLPLSLMGATIENCIMGLLVTRTE